MSPIIDSNIRSIQCDGPECTKLVLYDRKAEKETFELPENVWLRATRVTQTADGRNLVFCSDVCQINSIAMGTHNVPEPPKIVTATNPAAVAAAAKAAAGAKAAEAAVRSGVGKIEIAD